MNRVRKSKRPLAPRAIPTECLSCGEPQPWVVNTVEISAPFRGTQHTVSASVNQCRHCDAISTSPEQLEAISAKVRDAHKVWVATRFKKAMKELGLTIDGFVMQTGLPRATVARASSGEPLIEASNEKLLWHEIETLREKRFVRMCTAMSQRGKMRPIVIIQASTQQAAIQISYAKILKTVEQSPVIAPRQDEDWRKPDVDDANVSLQPCYV
jgi:hypothetical protein